MVWCRDRIMKSLEFVCGVFVLLSGGRLFGDNRPNLGPPTPPRVRPALARESSAEAVPTPMVELVRVLKQLPKPTVAGVDFGCGSDARACVVMAELWPDADIFGIEIDPYRAAAAKQRIRDLGLQDRVTIICGDATAVDVKADVFFVYLFDSVLKKLRPKLAAMKAGASYMHQPPGLPTTRDGDSWIYTRPAPPVTQIPTAVWQGRTFTDPVCDNPNCGMCAELRRQLQISAAAIATQSVKTEQPKLADPVVSQPPGHWENRQICQFNSRGRKIGCSIKAVWVRDRDQ